MGKNLEKQNWRRSANQRLVKGQGKTWNRLGRPDEIDMIAGMFRAIVCLGLITAALAGEPLNLLVNASASFSAAIIQQLAAVQSDPSPTDFAEKTIAYSKAKAAYFIALRAAMLELENIATGKEPRPRELDQFAMNFSVAGEKQEQAADEQTLFLLKQLSFDPDIEKARAEFDRAQKVEERFHKDFNGVDFTIR